MTLPTVAFRAQTTAARRWPVVYQARSLSLTCLTEQALGLTRAGTLAATDSAGVSRTCNYYQPAFEYDSTSGKVGLKLNTSSYLTIGSSWPMLPVASCGLIDFIEQGPTASSGLFYIGNDAVSGARFTIDVSGGVYRITHNNGSSSVTDSLGAAPSSGQRVRMRWWIYSDGKVQIWQSINGAAETTNGATSALALASSWGSTTQCRINAIGTANNGARSILGFVIGLGNQSQAALMAALAG